MSFLESDSTDQKTQAGARHNRCIVSLILLAADLRVIVGRRGFGKLTVIVKELEAINATYVQQPRRNPGFSRYIEEASLLRSVCREKSRESPVGERTKPTRELTLHPEPPGGLYLVYRLVHEPRPRQFRQGRASCKFG
jgi:hypothetical protein